MQGTVETYLTPIPVVRVKDTFGGYIRVFILNFKITLKIIILELRII